MSSASSGNTDSSNPNPAGAEADMNIIDEDQARELIDANVSMDINIDWKNFMSWMIFGVESTFSDNTVDRIDSNRDSASRNKEPSNNNKRKIYDDNGVEGTTDKGKEIMKKIKFSDSILDSFREDQKTGTFCDVIIQIEDQCFPAHRPILKAKSDYFHAMFSGNFQESESDRKKIVLKAIPVEGFKIVIDFVYGRELNFTLDNISDVYKCADMMFIPDLIEECKVAVVKLFEPREICNLEPKMCLKAIMTLHNLCVILNMVEFTNTMVPSFTRQVLMSKNSREILLLTPVELLTKVVKVELKYCVARDINLLLFIIEWLKQNPGVRLRRVGPLFQQINFDHVPRNLACLSMDTIGRLCLKCKMKLDKLGISKILSSMHRTKSVEEKRSKMESFNYLVCLFSQDQVTLKGEVRVYEEGETKWRRKELVLQEPILQSVEVRGELVLLSYQSYYIVNLRNFEVSCHEANHLLRFDQGFVACAQNDRLIVAGKSIYKCGRKECIIVCDFQYWKNKPSLVQLFYFKTTENNVIAMSSTKEAIFVLTTSTTLPTTALLCVKHNSFIGYYFIDSFSVNKENFSTRIFFDYNKNDSLFLMDSFNCDVMFSGVVLYLLNNVEVSEVWDRIANIQSDDPSPMEDWIGVVKGTLLSSCRAKEGHLILGSQCSHLMLIRMKHMKDWKIHEPLPIFDFDWPILDYERTNFMIWSKDQP